MSFVMQKRDRINQFEPKSGIRAGISTTKKDGMTIAAPSATFSGKGFPNPLIRPRRRFGRPRRLSADNTASFRPSPALVSGMEPSTGSKLGSDEKIEA